MASFQLSPVKTADERVENNVVAGEEGGRLLEMSYNAMVRDIVSLMTSFRKTAVEVKYRCPPTGGMTRE